MKRIAIWLVILATPTLIWFTISDNGKQAYSQWFNLKAEQTKNSPNGIILVPSPSQKRPQITLVPVPGMHRTKPYLQVSVKGGGSSRTPPSGLLVIDHQGRRTGYDSVQKQKYKEIPNSLYEVVPTPNIKPPRKILRVVIDPAEKSEYRIEVLGTEAGMYNLYVARHSSPGIQYIRTSQSEIIEAGELHSYTARLDDKVSGSFLTSQRIELLTSAKSIPGSTDVTSADVVLKSKLPAPQFNRNKQGSGKRQTYTDRENGFSLSYAATDQFRSDWRGKTIGSGNAMVVVKVIPDAKDAKAYQYNSARTPLWVFAAKALPLSIGMYADGPDGGISPEGIVGTKRFTNAHGVTGIQTFVAHLSVHFTGEGSQADESYEYQGPAYLIPLKPKASISPVLIIAPYGSSSHVLSQRNAWLIANSVKLENN